jgi:hydroxymethylpyrimidine/phosphomethylpyrimidine kinase
MIRSSPPIETSPRRRRIVGKRAVPVVLTIAGSDNSGGAGLQADLKTFTTLGVYGTSAVTCVVAEHPGRVLNITPLPPQRVADQIRLVLEAFPVAAIKTGMLHSAEIIAAVSKAIMPALKKSVPLVIDPVMVASTGRPLMKGEALRALRKFMALATVVTPNRDEAALLWGGKIEDLATLEEAALALARDFAGPDVLAKGGHLRSGQAVDILASPAGRVQRFSARRIPGIDPHGTGCTYSAAIAAGLARGFSVPEAVAAGKRFIARAIRNRFEIGGYALLNHLPEKKTST